jgi:hypothetical protein
LSILSTGDPELIEAIGLHIQHSLGRIHCVWHEIVSRHVHVDLYHVAATSRRPFEVIVTSGMSERPMQVPGEARPDAYAELVAILPRGWPLDDGSLQDERHGWPLRLIADLARHPHEHGSWLWHGHTICEPGEPAPAYAPGTALDATILLPPVSLPRRFSTLDAVGRHIHFFAAVPLYWEELQVVLRDGMEALLGLLRRHRICDVIDPLRVNVARLH